MSATASTDSAAGSAWSLLFAAWMTSATATLGALFFSEVMGVPPCVLCWYQRICMFPLVVVLGLALFPLDVKIVRYALPLAGVGLAVAAFHLLLLHGAIPEPLRPCTAGVPCTEKVIEWAGFVTLPLLSALAFSAIIAFLLLARRAASK